MASLFHKCCVFQFLNGSPDGVVPGPGMEGAPHFVNENEWKRVSYIKHKHSLISY